MIGQLGKSWMFLIRVIWKVGIKLKKKKFFKLNFRKTGKE